MHRSRTMKAAVAAAAVAVLSLVSAPAASAHEFGVCHVTPSGVIILKTGGAGRAHHHLLRTGVHEDDYLATAEDVAYSEQVHRPRCVGSVNP